MLSYPIPSPAASPAPSTAAAPRTRDGVYLAAYLALLAGATLYLLLHHYAQIDGYELGILAGSVAGLAWMAAAWRPLVGLWGHRAAACRR